MQDPVRQIWPVLAPQPYQTHLYLPAWSELLDLSGQERVLEVGCGDCAFLAELAPLVGELVGLECTAPGAVGADETLRDLDKPCFLFIGYFLEFNDDMGFDAIVIRKGLDQVQAERRLDWANHCSRLLRPGGVVYLADETAPPEAGMLGEHGWHAALIAGGLVIRQEVSAVPKGLELLAYKPEPRAASFAA